MLGSPLGADPRSDLLSQHDAPDVSMVVQVEYDDGEVIVFAEADVGGVHYFQAESQNVHVGDVVEFLGAVHFERIGVVDAIHSGCFQNGLGLDLHGAQRRGGIGREIEIARSAGKNHDSPLLQVTNSSAANERLGPLVHNDRKLRSCIAALLLQSI